MFDLRIYNKRSKKTCCYSFINFQMLLNIYHGHEYAYTSYLRKKYRFMTLDINDSFFSWKGHINFYNCRFYFQEFNLVNLIGYFFTFNVQTHHNFFCQLFQYHAQNMSIRAHQSCTKYIFKRVYTCKKFEHPIFETLRAHFGLRVHNILTLLHSERPKLYRVSDVLIAIGLKTDY